MSKIVRLQVYFYPEHRFSVRATLSDQYKVLTGFWIFPTKTLNLKKEGFKIFGFGIANVLFVRKIFPGKLCEVYERICFFTIIISL